MRILTPCSYVNQIQDLLNRGAPISGIGLQSHLGPDVIDLGQVESAVRRLWDTFHLPIWVTEFDWNGDQNGDHGQHAVELDNFYRLMMRWVQLQPFLSLVCFRHHIE